MPRRQSVEDIMQGIGRAVRKDDTTIVPKSYGHVIVPVFVETDYRLSTANCSGARALRDRGNELLCDESPEGVDEDEEDDGDEEEEDEDEEEEEEEEQEEEEEGQAAEEDKKKKNKKKRKESRRWVVLTSVLRGLGQADCQLKKELAKARQELGRGEPQANVFAGSSLFSGKVDIRLDSEGLDLSLDDIKREVLTEVVTSVTSSWDEQLGKLQKCRETGAPSGPRLEGWLHRQRKALAGSQQYRLTSSQRDRLAEAGIHAGKSTKQRQEQYIDELKNPETQSSPAALAWAKDQRKKAPRSKAAAERLENLRRAGGVERKRDAEWLRGLKMLQTFAAAHKHCKPPQASRGRLRAIVQYMAWKVP